MRFCCADPLSDFRHIPDHQEVWADADTDQSIIIELNAWDDALTDEQAARSDTSKGASRGASERHIRLSSRETIDVTALHHCSLASYRRCPSSLRSHYMHELSSANDALSSELLSTGTLTAEAMPEFESVRTKQMRADQSADRWRLSAPSDFRLLSLFPLPLLSPLCAQCVCFQVFCRVLSAYQQV